MSREKIRKYYDVGPTSIAATDVYSGGATGWAGGLATFASNNRAWLTDLSQSDDDQGRVGQSINVETLDVRVQVSPDLLSAVGVTQTLRMLIYADMECDGAGPLGSEVLTQSSVASGMVMSFLNPSYFGRFKIIEDKIWTWTENGGILTFPTGPSDLFYERHHDLKGHRVMWDASNASLIANARKGHIFLYFIFQQNTVAAGGIPTIATTAPPAVQYVTRIRYTDT